MSETTPSQAFTSLPLPPELLSGLEALDYRVMTPIQAQSLPLILAGRDVIGQGKTGSGKTAAFGLGLLSRLDISRFQVQALVLCPTRELADQVAGEIRKLARGLANVKVLTLCGGAPMGPQLNSLASGAHVIVGTPGRVEAHLRKGALDLVGLDTLVLDEADRMLDMGFQDALEAIVSRTPATRQTLLFSATYADGIRPLGERLMSSPAVVEVESTHSSDSIRQAFFRVDDDAERFMALRLLLLKQKPASSAVFCNTKREAQDIADALCQHGFSALALHGDLEQRDRDRTLILFANQSVSILVATDVAARGLDIESLDAVFNYRIAQDPEAHVHRIGRTGRAGSQGAAYTIYTPDEGARLTRLADQLGGDIDDTPLPPASLIEERPAAPRMATLQVDGGRKQKLRPGDILGALTGDEGISGGQVGKIKVLERSAYVAVERDVASKALEKLATGKLKGKSFRARRVNR